MRTALLLLISMAAVADTAADVQSVFSGAAEALINDDATGFLEAFDRDMPEYAALRSNIEGLLAAYEVGSTIEAITDEGDEQKRMIELDWLLITTEKFAINSTPQTRRGAIQCRVERRGKKWKITGLDPVNFFKK